ncbi:MAG: hypothetical protein WC683_13765 [bacterium]
MAIKKVSTKELVIPCELLQSTRKQIVEFAAKLKKAAPRIYGQGLTKDEFDNSAIFRSAIEHLRGVQAASMAEKKSFINDILNHLKKHKKIKKWDFTGGGERHDYQLETLDNRLIVFEAKGCLDGNNTNIFQRPQNADEFYIWSLCQNPGADPRHNVWSGLHTRLGATIIAEKQRVDGLIVWDMVCGTVGRPCPKTTANPKRRIKLQNSRLVPPPCLYLFPRSIPDPRNNPEPKVWSLDETRLLKILFDVFGCKADEVTSVRIQSQMKGPDVQRKTILERDGLVVAQSEWTTIKRAAR